MVRDKLKGFSKDVAIYGAGDALGRMIGLIMLPILSRIFGPADYGAIELLSVGYGFLLMLARFSVDTGVQRYYYRVEGRERQRLVTSCLVHLMWIDTILAALLFVFARAVATVVSGPPDVVFTSIRILAVCLLVEQVWSYLVLLLRLNRRAVAFSVSNVALVVLTPTLTFALVVGQDAGLVGVFQAKLVALAIVAVGLAFATRREFTRAADFGTFVRVFRFAIPGHPGLLVAQVLALAPRYLLAAFAPLSQVGLLSIAMKLSSVMRVAIQSFNRAWNPFAYANEGSEDEKRVYEVVFKGLVSAIIILVAGIAVFSPEVLAVLAPAEYGPAAALVPWVVASLGIDGVVRFFSTILYTRDRVVWSTYFGIGQLVLFLTLGFLLVPRFQALGLAWSLAATAAAHAIAYGMAALRLFAFSVPYTRLVLAIAGTVVIVWGTLSLDLTLLPRVLAKTVALIALSLGTIALLLTREEIARVRRLTRRSP